MSDISQLVYRPKIKRRGHPQTNPRSLANLIPYKPGQNGHGRVYPMKERLYHALTKPLVKPADDAPHGDQIVYATLKGAVELVPVAFRETWDRVEGKVPDKNLLLGDITIRIVDDDEPLAIEEKERSS